MVRERVSTGRSTSIAIIVGQIRAEASEVLCILFPTHTPDTGDSGHGVTIIKSSFDGDGTANGNGASIGGASGSQVSFSSKNGFTAAAVACDNRRASSR